MIDSEKKKQKGRIQKGDIEKRMKYGKPKNLDKEKKLLLS